jgi:hypothetical protein
VCEIWGFFRKGLAVVDRACAVRTALCVGKCIVPRSRRRSKGEGTRTVQIVAPAGFGSGF